MKTVEEAAMDYAVKTDRAYAQYVSEDFKAGVDFAQRWIPVTEELPEIGEIILAKDRDGSFSTATYKGDNIFEVDFSDIVCAGIAHKFTVTHWRRIELK